MRAVIAIAILCLVLLLVGLIAYILARRLGNVMLASYRARRRAALEPAFRAWLDGTGTATRAITRPGRLVDRDLLVDFVLASLRTAGATERGRLLGWLQEQGLISLWIRQLDARSSWMRGAAAERLAVVRDARSAPALVRLLDDPVFDVRMRAAKALCALGGTEARQALIGALGDESRWSVIRIADLLAEMGPEVVGELTAAFPGLGRTARLATVDLVARLGDAGITPFLAGLLDDLDRDVRARAASALGRVGDGRGVGGLTAALQDAEWPVRAMAAKALGLLGARPAADALAASLRDREWWVRANAAEALSRMPPEGIDRLFRMLDDQDRFARDQALAALESSGELARRLAALCSSDATSRGKAQALLHTLSTHQPRGRVEALRDQQADSAIRGAINVYLRQAAAGKESAP